METFSRIFCQYWHDRIPQLLQICGLHIHDMIPHFKGDLMDWNLETVEEIWVIHCHVQDTMSQWMSHQKSSSSETHQTRKCVSTLVLSNFSEPVPLVVSFPVLRWQEWNLVWSSGYLSPCCILTILLCPLTLTRLFNAYWIFSPLQTILCKL